MYAAHRRPLALLGLAGLLFGCGPDPVEPPQYGLYLTVAVVAEVEGRFSPADPGDSRVALVRPFVAGPRLEPDYLDHPAVPLCMGFTFGATEPPNVVSGDAGRLRISGLSPVTFRDLTQGPAPGPAMSAGAELACQIGEVGQTSPYVCDMPSNALLDPGDALLGTEPLRLRVEGGAEVGAFEVSGLVPAATATTAGGFALDSVDPRGPVLAQWSAPDADLVMIELLGQRVDGSLGAQVLCLANAADGQRALPAEALALIPEPTPGVPVGLQTSLVALRADRGYVGWGNYLFAAGRGHFGVTVLSAD